MDAVDPRKTIALPTSGPESLDGEYVNSVVGLVSGPAGVECDPCHERCAEAASQRDER
jgi:hypothetical protein